MRNTEIVSDSSCDLTEELVKQYNITVIPFLVSFDGEVYYKENLEITNTKFYKTLRSEDVYPKTSLPTIEDYSNVFRGCISRNSDVVCMNLTSKFSGSHQSAVNAAQIINKEVGEERIFVVDSMQATAAQGAVVLEAAKMRDEGLSAAIIHERINKIKETCIMYVTVDSLTYLQKGGRVGKANALAGSLLNIKPLIVLREGELLPIAKVRGRKKAISEIMKYVNKDTCDNPDDYEFFLGQADVFEEAQTFAAAAEHDFGIKLSYPIMEVGVTIGAHIGPTAIGFGYIKKHTTI